jgi:MarR family transcriptional regulator, organic hydroperoxide resistance regulator
MSNSETDSVDLILDQFIKVQRQIMYSRLAKIGLYPGQPPVLAALCKNNGCSQKELVNSLSVKPATITVTIQRMEKAGLLECRADEKDLRVSRVYITDKGRELNTKVEEITKNIEKECFVGFTQEEKILLRRFLIQMRDNLKDKGDGS